jgi:multicomponent Na+:H+ antiporter subunit D
MWMTELPPFVPFYVAALLALVLRGNLRYTVLLLVPVLGGLHLWQTGDDVLLQMSLFDYDLSPYRTDKLSLLFGYLFHIAAFIAVIFSLHVRDTLQHVASMIYIGSALGAVFAGDLLTLFIFWELLALSSVFLIWARRTTRSLHAGFRYLFIQLLSGLLLLAGSLMILNDTGSLAFNQIGLHGPAGWLIFIAFGIKCAFPLLHNWLTDAYPEATPTGTVFLSAFTTKVAVYALARGYPGTELLIYIGAVMTCFPIFYAVIENDLRRVLAYSMINQIGFMVCGIGIGTALAINGAIAHAFNDVIFKGLLFMTMGAVLHMTGRMNGSDLGGLYKTMPVTTTLCIVGAASISAFPLFSGFVSKSMIMSAALAEDHHWIWLFLLFASAGVFHHAGIKIPYFAFFAHDSGIRVSEPPRNMLLAMTLAAVLCITIGCFPQILYELLPYNPGYSAYDTTHVLAQLQLLFFSALAFVWLNLQGLYPPEMRSVNIDAEWVYRKLLPDFIGKLISFGKPVDQAIRLGVMNRLSAVTESLSRHHGPGGILARTHPTGNMVLLVAVMLFFYLVFYY